MAPRIIVIGGGTGSYAALMGLKVYTHQLTAVVSVADDGGSSGRLRDEFGHLPPGDLRKCLLALSPSDNRDQVLRRLFDYRFDRGQGLNGHSFGNLLLTALTEITGSSESAIREAGRLLDIRGRVLPVTLADTRLVAQLDDGTVVRGETNIDARRVNPEIPIRRIFLDPDVRIHDETREALLEADVIVMGPGDLYTSVLPNFLVQGVAEAIQGSAALKVYVSNLMTKHGETDGFRASDFLSEILRYLGPKGNIDWVLLNEANYPDDLLGQYASFRSYPVYPDVERCEELSGGVVMASMTAAGTLLRHDPDLLAKQVVMLAEQHGPGVL